MNAKKLINTRNRMNSVLKICYVYYYFSLLQLNPEVKTIRTWFKTIEIILLITNYYDHVLIS